MSHPFREGREGLQTIDVDARTHDPPIEDEVSLVSLTRSATVPLVWTNGSQGMAFSFDLSLRLAT